MDDIYRGHGSQQCANQGYSMSLDDISRKLHKEHEQVKAARDARDELSRKLREDHEKVKAASAAREQAYIGRMGSLQNNTAETAPPPSEIDAELRGLEAAVLQHGEALNSLFRRLTPVLSAEAATLDQSQATTPNYPGTPAGSAIRQNANALGMATADIYAIIGRLGV